MLYFKQQVHHEKYILVKLVTHTDTQREGEREGGTERENGRERKKERES